ncbi:Mini-ribonuclease 3 [Gloeobacter kilaueensis]|uniref:Mini-ribonuclease 3 n=1 Tax=Gloeobacter kilaueensis (strain ATCC BAA-2537 / CCAP 1431/1 / ULC 316 / JS1) TaxID=1183438 RepID=U5QJ52_GLOK1|nr:ribonuclease III domain-containing protein [Gloeobacter kilaueensis]AGY57710.1 hypothetical protein GKIL_1464 [Gloeobacter kilaueensis JS1]
MDSSQIRTLPLEALAYLGDAVWELHVRSGLIYPPQRLRRLHERTVERVRAAAQATLLGRLEAQLTSEEAEWVRRGRNAATGVPRHLDGATYRLATAFETLLGYLFLADRERLAVVLHLCDELQHHGPNPAPPET